ncbi:MAG: hypothetical protein SFX73_25605 [Kofleriaceae bacterium]|nr:hypothetical protein [Kofleriaceae bacterium]
MIRLVLLSVALVACVPELVDDTSVVREPRLLAARSEPAEARPGDAITTTALWVGPDGEIADAPLAWAFCTTRKAFTEPGPVAPSCLASAAPELVAFGTGATATGALPEHGCRLFGPDPPDPVPGEAAARPADPDGTGGYYQPVRVGTDARGSLAQVRIRCGLPEATPEQALRYQLEYAANTNPSVAWSAPPPATLRASEAVELAVQWPATEAYLWFDPVARALTERREAMRVAWFATAGTFDTGHTGRSEAEAALTKTANRWTAPDAPGVVHVWAVLRDDRGGVSWIAATLQVE